MAAKLVVYLGLVVLAKGAVVPAIPAEVVPAVAGVPVAKLEELDAIPQYSFAYDVQDAVTGDSKAQYETRNGDLVQGSYSLIEADGTRRIVQYTADSINGFNAVVSREPATAVAAIAAPLVPYTPAIAPVGPAAAPAPVPAIPASGPDSDVEVVEARSGPLVADAPITREQQLRQQQEQQLRQLEDIQRQQQEQQQFQRQQQQARLRQQFQQRQQLEQQQFEQQQPQARLQQQNQQRQRPRQQREREQLQAAPVRALASPLQLAPQAQALVGLPAAKATTYATYTNYPTAYAYTAAYTSPIAYAAPINQFAYAPAATVL